MEKCDEFCDFFFVNFELVGNLGVGIIFESKSMLNILMEIKVDWVDIKVVFGNFVSWVKNNNVMSVDSVLKELECILVEFYNFGEGNILKDLK